LLIVFQQPGRWRVPGLNRYPWGLELCSWFVHIAIEENAMDAGKQRQIIRLWNQLRRLERAGGSTEAVRRQIEKALAEREPHAT